MSNNCAIILAAGKGRRMGADINKQFLKLKDKPILYYTLKAFSEHEDINEVILVAAESEIEYCKKEVIDKYNIKKVTKIVKGGKERQDSVFNGLKVLEECRMVLIHDGARPFVSKDIIDNGIKYARLYGSSACGVAAKDTIKIIDKHGFSTSTLNRDTLVCIQTPQIFDYNIIMDCHLKSNKVGYKVTDDTMVVEKYGHKVYLYQGSYNNIKITTQEDIIIGERILNSITCEE
jgi:2-C-methyl-D-erythritol 4-phosphate cytidylyltransferase